MSEEIEKIEIDSPLNAVSGEPPELEPVPVFKSIE